MKPGDKVLCVNVQRSQIFHSGIEVRRLLDYTTYTIREINPDCYNGGEAGVLLNEIANPFCNAIITIKGSIRSGELYYGIARFIPFDPEKIEQEFLQEAAI